MKVSEIMAVLDKEFPPAAAEEWDNIGLLIGRADREVKKVLLTLDVTPASAEEAIKNGVQMIISHHPMMFNKVGRITSQTAEGRIILSLAEHKIAVFAAHTNMDSAKRGLNAELAAMFGLQKAVPVEANAVSGAGLGRIGDLKTAVTAREFALRAKELLKTTVRISGDSKRMVKRVAVGSGACDDIIPKALEMGADLILTGDCKYHRNLDYVNMGAVVVDAGHYPTEVICMDIFERVLANTKLEIIKSKNRDVFEFI